MCECGRDVNPDLEKYVLRSTYFLSSMLYCLVTNVEPQFSCRDDLKLARFLETMESRFGIVCISKSFMCVSFELSPAKQRLHTQRPYDNGYCILRVALRDALGVACCALCIRKHKTYV